MEGKRGMERKQEKKSTKAVKLLAGASLAAFLAAAAVFAALLWVEKNELENYEKKEVYVAVREVPEGQLITEKNAGEFFEKTLLDVNLVPETAITEEAIRTDQVVCAKIEKGVFPTLGMFQTVEKITAGMREPVVAGFRAEDLCQVVGGVLRAGDRIHVYADEEGQGTFLIWENVYVQQVFDAGGAVIESGDETTAAQRINVFLDKEDVEAFYTRLDQGSLRVVKIWRKAGVG